MKNTGKITIGGHIFAAGFGTRMKPITNTTPKPLIKIHGKPIIQYSLDLLSSIPEMNTITINTFHLPEQFNYLHNEKKKVFVYKEPYILGHAKTLELWNKYHTEDVIIAINSDTIYSIQPKSLTQLARRFYKNSQGADIGVVIKFQKNGPLGITNNNSLLGVYRKNSFLYYQQKEKIAKQADSTGIYFIRKELFTDPIKVYKNQSFVGFFGQDDLLQNLLQKGHRVHLFTLQKLNTYGITYPAEIAHLNSIDLQTSYE